MKSKAIWAAVTFVLLLSMVLISCGEEEATTTAPTTTQPPAATTAAPPATTAAPPATTAAPPATTAAPANWWDAWGEPQYGGTLALRSQMIDVITEPQDPRSSQFGTWLEVLFADNMLTDREEFGFKSTFTPLQYRQGWLATGYEYIDPTTIEVTIQEGVSWQNKSPTWGREFTAFDVQYSYERILGNGEFEGKDPNAFYVSLIPSVESVIATDDHTVIFNMKTANAMGIYDVVEPFLSLCMTPREWVEMSDEDRADWRNVPGTGPFILTDLVPGTSLTSERNEEYWRYDSRNPGNKLPYLDSVRVVVIPDMATSIAAMKTGRIDMLADDRSHASPAQAQALLDSYPEITEFKWPYVGQGLYMRSDIEPFDDINLRKAVQMAIDIPTITENYYYGYALGTPAGLLSPIIGEDWVIPYDQWPAELQAEYSYDVDGAMALIAASDYPDGFTVSVNAATTDDMNLLQILQGQLSEVGITMNINGLDMTIQRVVVLDGTYTDEMVYVGIAGNTNPPGTAAGSYWSGKYERTGGAYGVEDPVYEDLMAQFNVAETMEEAQSLFKQMDMYALEQHWSALTTPAWTSQFCQPWLKGWAGEHFWGCGGWFIRSHMWVDASLK